MAEAVSCWPFNGKAWFHSQTNPCRFCSGQSSTWRTEVLGGKSDLVTPFPPHIHPSTKTNPVS